MMNNLSSLFVPMKFIRLFIIPIASLLLFVACDNCQDCGQNSDGCEDGICQCKSDYYGDFCQTYCVNGVSNSLGICECEAGYMDENCLTLEREDFLGEYNCFDTSASIPNNYTLSISGSEGDLTRMVLSADSGFALNFQNPVEATIDYPNFWIAEQTPDGEGEGSISGVGRIIGLGDTIRINYNCIYPGGVLYPCSATLLKTKL